MSRAVALAMLLVLAACAGDVEREEWQRMTFSEKTLYVNSLAGAAKARERKGGTAVPVVLPAEEIVAAIDAAYAGGDQRRTEEIFNTLVARQGSPQPPQPASP